MHLTRLAAVATLILIVACSGRDSTDGDLPDGGEVVSDAVSWGDKVAETPDTASDDTDAEASLGDTPDNETAVETDSAEPIPESVSEELSEVAEPGDTSPPEDTGPEELIEPETQDSADEFVEEITPGPIGDNVLAHGSFEDWAEELPVGWLGAATNLSSSLIAEEAGLAHDGLLSCRLTNADDSHKRFSTEPMALEAGKYSCRYWVHGEGEIRNGRYYADDYSSYSGYTSVYGDAWDYIDYDFNLAADADDFELVFSLRNTSETGLVIDDVLCVRAEQACDTVVCEDWQVCENPDGDCVSAPGKCADDSECASWQHCSEAHECVLDEGACASTADCDGDTPACDLDSHLCVAGDPCEGVDCQDWQVCEPSDGSCVTAEGRCVELADCDQDLPVCKLSTHTCVAVDTGVNVVPNGGFEAWETVIFGRATEFQLPEHWYGICDGCTPYWPTTEIDANKITPYTTATHSGDTALQLIETGTPADRFVSEPFTVSAGATYECAYWVRGHGTHRHRGYCGGWNVDTDYQAIDSDEWQQVTFELGGATSWCVIILYASNTDADRDHLQFDDVVCIKP
jgi:hypothetical protein